WSDPHLISIVLNSPPNKPTIEGPVHVLPFITYKYTIYATDDDGDNVRFYIDWGDGSSQWYGPFASGEIATVEHKWKKSSTIKIKARDTVGDESEWTILEIILPKNKALTFNTIILKLLQRFSKFFSILNFLPNL
ncbi:MAG: hypothetical protein ACQXXF_08740, partial [Thermoplasmatota archaeon]